MKKIAIISYYHTESSLCLAKYIGKKNFLVDYYFFRSLISDRGEVSGIEYKRAPRRLGIYRFKKEDIPEIMMYTGEANVNYFIIGTLGESRRYRWMSWIIMKLSMVIIKCKKYDIINVIGQAPPVLNIHESLKAQNLVHTIHEVGSHQDGIKTTPLMDAIIKDRSKVIFHSISTFQRFADIGDVSKNIISIIPFGVFETNLLYEQKVAMSIRVPSTKLIFLFFGRLKPYKGLDLLVEAVNILKSISDKYVLIIAGGGSDPNLDYFKKADNCIVINKHLSNSEMIFLNRLSNVVLMPYHSASQTGITSITFMLGKPIIATNVGALPEVIKDGINGLIIEKDNPVVLAKAMRKLIEEPSLLDSLNCGASMYGHGDEFDWNNIAEKTINFYFNE